MADVINKIETGTGAGQLGTVLDGKQIDEALLLRLLPNLHAYEDAKKTVLQDNDGTRAYWFGFRDLDDTNDGEITEGVTPDSVALSPFESSAKVKQYGKPVELTDMLLKHSKYPKIQAETIELLSEWGAKIIDRLIYRVLANQTLRVRGGNGKAITATLAGSLEENSATITLANTSGDTALTATDYVTEADFEWMYVALTTANVPKFADGYYHVQADAMAMSDIRQFQKFIDKSKYQDPTGAGLTKNEVGKMGGFKFIECTKMPRTTVGEVVCSNIYVYGRDAYAVVDCEDGRGKLTHVHKALGYKDSLNLKASEGVKFEQAAKVLCDPTATVANPKDQRIIRLLAPTRIAV